MTFRLVALGDSTVEGLEDPGPDGTYVGWADRFAHHLALREPELRYANLAVRGQTSDEVLATQLAPGLALQPDLALLVAGVNDLLQPRLDRTRLRANLLRMYAELGEAGARVLTFTMPDMTRVAPIAVALRPRIAFLNRVIREAGTTYGTTVVDVAAEPVSSHPALWHDDRLHANREGHRRIAMALAEAVGIDAGDWRSEPPESPAAGWLRLAATELQWVVGHLAPWAWGRLRGTTEEEPKVCKRPDLLPVAPLPR